MAHINRKFIDKHWLVSIIRGVLAATFGIVTLFGAMRDWELLVSVMAVFLLCMGIIDSASALYASVKKHGWINSIFDAAVDVIAALFLLFFAQNNLLASLIIISAYTFVSGVIDIFHGFLSTVDPTDRFIRVITGILGCVMGLVILNAGDLEITTFIRFFGAYMLIVSVTSMIYGVHNRAQNIEDKVARKESAKKGAAKKASAKKSPAKTPKKK